MKKISLKKPLDSDSDLDFGEEKSKKTETKLSSGKEIEESEDNTEDQNVSIIE